MGYWGTFIGIWLPYEPGPGDRQLVRANRRHLNRGRKGLKAIFILAALISVIIAAAVIVLVIKGIATMITNRYKRKQRYRL